MPDCVVIDITEEIYPQILKINKDNVELLSPLDCDALRRLLGMAALRKAVLLDGRVAGFLIAVREGAGYQSVNYKWFAGRFERFLYVDRVAVAEECRRAAIGSMLYEIAFECARGAGLEVVAAEINIEPENRPSLRFHERFGFREIGRQVLDGGKKTVSMQIAGTAARNDR